MNKLKIKNIDFTKIGTYLKTIRLINNFTQEYVCEQVNISQTWLGGIESNINVPSLSVLNKLIKLYNIKIDIKLNN